MLIIFSKHFPQQTIDLVSHVFRMLGLYAFKVLFIKRLVKCLDFFVLMMLV